MSEEKVQVVLKIPPKARAIFNAMAASDGRTKSGFLVHLIKEEALRRRQQKQES